MASGDSETERVVSPNESGAILSRRVLVEDQMIAFFQDRKKCCGPLSQGSMFRSRPINTELQSFPPFYTRKRLI
jgi:hypothetical protein